MNEISVFFFSMMYFFNGDKIMKEISVSLSFITNTVGFSVHAVAVQPSNPAEDSPSDGVLPVQEEIGRYIERVQQRHVLVDCLHAQPAPE